MSDNIFWILAMEIKDIAAFKSLVAEACKSTLAEEGALNYEFMLNEDESICHVYERYADSAATLIHLGNFNEKFASRLMPIVQITSFTVYGEPSDDVRGILDTLGAAYMKPFAGFSR